uniref:C1q domain-containing protein n=1 Tax=Mesocestoides corti TaxID=53468 RepID=A0A5K3EHH9_MESCO
TGAVTSSSALRGVANHLRNRQQRVAFFAGLQPNIEEMPPGQRVVMTHVLTNVGKAYDPTKGQFCAPVDGVYSFLVTISAQGRKQAAVRLMHNDNHIFDVWSDSSPWSTATNQAILTMKKNDCTWLQLRESAFYLHGYMYSTFAGYLIFEYPVDQT